MSNSDINLAWKYHDATKHSYFSVRTTAHYLDWANMPSPFKIYPEIEPIALPRDLIQTGAPALDAIAASGAETSGEAIPNLDQLASLLYYSAGITKKKSYPGGEIYFRAAACAGALYPIEVYIVCGDIEGLEAGVYHFSPGDFALRRLREGDFRPALVRAVSECPDIAAAPVTLVYTAITWRSAWKYRDRSYRYHFWDNGVIVANALAVAAAHKLRAKVVMGFVDAQVNKLVGVDGENEFAVSLLTLGRSAQHQDGSAADGEIPALSPATVPLSHAQVDYPLIREMHRASWLATTDDVADWRVSASVAARPEPAGELFPLAQVSAERLPGDTLEEVIQRRASTRRFAREAISFEELSEMIDRATRGTAADVLAAGSQLNDVYVISNRVDGLDSGAYYFRPADRSLELLRRGEFSDKAAYLSLDQDLGGDASATLFFMCDLDPVLSQLGNRGYRAAQMEAGILGGRLYLGAYSLRRGATGLTFYDDDVTSFFSPHAAGKSCIFEVALGVPGKKPMY
ncbi:MAG TPA: SagB/ThcOx family dehydrogenase [Blastocatellia bacterium]|nr:SagB/ThcOx family dehydrogenase [Blastocatellia bacterium]